MRVLALAPLAIVTLLAAAPAHAQTYGEYPVCLHVYGPITYYECRYTSISQCNAAAAGRAAQCVVNPYAAMTEPPPRSYRRRGHVY